MSDNQLEPIERAEALLAHLERHGYGDDTPINETIGFNAGHLRALVTRSKQTEPLGDEVERVARAIANEMDVDPDVFIGMHGIWKWCDQWHPIAKAAIAASLKRSG